MFKRLLKMYKMAVWTADGQQLMPAFNYDGTIFAYTDALTAIKAWRVEYGFETAEYRS